jgi:8-oxo-dGTP pyrophosphatase MutT (NUDIX family)
MDMERFLMIGKMADARQAKPQMDSSDPRLDLASPLRPGNSAAAIIVVEKRYLLQLRDSKRDIFFPAHWGCFGGAAEDGETPGEALARELAEELHFDVEPAAMRYFTRFDFDYGFAALSPNWRYYYQIEIAPEQLPALRLQEGAGMQQFLADSILTSAIPLMPYDAHALWLHVNRRRLVG